MALPSQTKSEKSLSKGELAFLEALERGERPADIAKRRYPNNPAKRKALRRKLWRRLQRDGRIQRAIAERGQANLLLGIIPATVGLASRSARKTDAAKLVLEATGVHTPRQQVEHGGTVTVKLDIPRPKFDGVGDSEDPPLVDTPAE